MGKQVEKIINRFDRLREDKRTKASDEYSITKHFDTLRYKTKLVPQIKTEADETKAFDIKKFLYAPYASSNILFGLGIVDTVKICLYLYDIDSGFSGGWTGGSYLKYASTGRDEDVLFYYKDYMYVWGDDQLVRLDVTNSTNDFALYKSITFTTVVQPVHHSSDDIAYFFADNDIHKLNGVTWTDNALVLPTNIRITCATEYGNYLAIGGVENATGSNPRSIVFLWDRDSSLTTLTERLDFGQGKLVHLAVLNNKLIGVMDIFASTFLGRDRGKIVVKQGSGQFGITINEILTDDLSAGSGGVLPKGNFIADEKLYFPCNAKLNGDPRGGVWVVDSNGRMSLELVEFDALQNVGAITERSDIQSVYAVGNTWWFAHSSDGSVSRTSDQNDFDTTNASIYETLILRGDDSGQTKKLIGVEVMTEKLPTAGQIVLKYRKDEDIKVANSAYPSWTTIFTEATDDSISHGAVNIESTGATLPQYKELQFRVESTGGAVITGIRYKYEIIDKQIF